MSTHVDQFFDMPDGTRFDAYAAAMDAASLSAYRDYVGVAQATEVPFEDLPATDQRTYRIVAGPYVDAILSAIIPAIKTSRQVSA